LFHVIELGNICNLECRSCPTRLYIRPKGFMDLDIFKNIVEQYIAYDDSIKKTRVVIHGYGDILLNPHLWDYLDYFQERGFSRIDFSDNAMLLTEEIIEKLCTYKIFSFIKLSLNSSRKDTMEYINTGSNFETVVNNIKMFIDIVAKRDNPFQVWVQLMKTNLNLDETTDDIRRLIGRTGVVYSETPIMGMLECNPTNNLLMPDFKFWGGTCLFSQESRMVHWDGDLVGCCVDNSKMQVYGNARDGIYSEKVESKRQQLQDEMERGDYKNLHACEVCEGKDNRVNKK